MRKIITFIYHVQDTPICVEHREFLQKAAGLEPWLNSDVNLRLDLGSATDNKLTLVIAYLF